MKEHTAGADGHGVKGGLKHTRGCSEPAGLRAETKILRCTCEAAA